LDFPPLEYHLAKPVPSIAVSYSDPRIRPAEREHSNECKSRENQQAVAET